MEYTAREERTLLRYGGEILASPGMQREKRFVQHGDKSVFDHSVAVALCCLALADCFRLPVDRRALVRGALLHDCFLYDWHIPAREHRFHGFTHPGRALRNAERDFALGRIERSMIRTHMFPLTPCPPTCREGVLLCVADKLCAAQETLTPLPERAVRLLKRWR